MSVPLRSSLLSQERFARAAWSRVAEPSDTVAAQLVATLGPVRALELVAAGERADCARFLPRLRILDVERDLEVGAKFGARIVCPSDPQWPSGLDDLATPPFCLWVRGDVDLAQACRRSAAVVGARASTAYGESVGSDLAAGLSERRFAVVSGAAFGIDAAAHRGTLAVGGLTVAVLAGGVERAYPSAHAALISQIAESGAVVSEVAPGSAPSRYRFLQRNRLIATMSRGTVVVEAGLRSGSLNTARTAAERGRVVAAVPGPVTSMMSAGCHELIRSGQAQLVTDAAEAAEALGDYGQDLAPVRRGPELLGDDIDGDASRVLGALPVTASASVGRLAVASGLSAPQVGSLLGRLELRGLAERYGDGWRQGAIVRRQARTARADSTS